MNTKAWRINEVSLFVHCVLPTDVPQSFCTFKLQSFDKTGHDQRKGCCSQREHSRAGTTRPNVVLLEFKQLFHLAVSTFVMKRKSGRTRRCRQGSKQSLHEWMDVLSSTQPSSHASSQRSDRSGGERRNTGRLLACSSFCQPDKSVPPMTGHVASVAMTCVHFRRFINCSKYILRV